MKVQWNVIPNRAVPEGPHSEFPQSHFRSPPTCLSRNATLTDLPQRTFRGLFNQRCGDLPDSTVILGCEARSSTLSSRGQWMIKGYNIMVSFSIKGARCGEIPNRAVPERPHSEFPQSRFRSLPTCLRRGYLFNKVIFSIRCSDVLWRGRMPWWTLTVDAAGFHNGGRMLRFRWYGLDAAVGSGGLGRCLGRAWFYYGSGGRRWMGRDDM